MPTSKLSISGCYSRIVPRRSREDSPMNQVGRRSSIVPTCRSMSSSTSGFRRTLDSTGTNTGRILAPILRNTLLFDPMMHAMIDEFGRSRCTDDYIFRATNRRSSDAITSLRFFRDVHRFPRIHHSRSNDVTRPRMRLIDRCQNSRDDRVGRREMISTLLRGARRREPYEKRESDRLIDADHIRLEDIHRRRIEAENDSKSSELTGLKSDATEPGSRIVPSKSVEGTEKFD